MAAKNKSNELRLTRVFDAPVRTVWAAWTDPEQVSKWWGPRGFSITTHSRDFRAGGHWDYTMHGPDGVDYANTTKYLEVEEGSKLVYDHGGKDCEKPLFRVTVTFSEVKGKTEMNMRMVLESAEAAEKTRAFVKKAGGESTWDRLAEYLEKETAGKEKFFINRSFNAPINLMYDTWTSAKHLAKWLAPAGASVEFIKADIKPGGSSFYCMTITGGGKMYGRIDYVDMQKPNRLVYKQQFCDENEKVTRHPMSATWPETMLTTVQFTEEGPEQTRVTLTWEPIGDITKEELETFLTARSGMTQGWTGSLDKLEEYFEKVAV